MVGILNLAMIYFHKTTHPCFLKDANKMVSFAFMLDVFMSALAHLVASPNLMPHSDFIIIVRSLFFLLYVPAHCLENAVSSLLTPSVCLLMVLVKKTLFTKDKDVFKQANLI